VYGSVTVLCSQFTVVSALPYSLNVFQSAKPTVKYRLFYRYFHHRFQVFIRTMMIHFCDAVCRYYTGLSMSSVMLLVLLCCTLGLFYGFCGKRPDGYGDDCCTKATGARFLILWVYADQLLFKCLAIARQTNVSSVIMPSTILKIRA